MADRNQQSCKLPEPEKRINHQYFIILIAKWPKGMGKRAPNEERGCTKRLQGKSGKIDVTDFCAIPPTSGSAYLFDSAPH